MPFEHQQLPKPTSQAQPQLRYQYHLPRNSQSQYHHNSSYNNSHNLSSFEVDHSTSVNPALLTELRDDHENIAKDLIEENYILRQQLRLSEQIIERLEGELQRGRLHENRSAIPLQQHSLGAFREEILLILEKNRMVEEELNFLRERLPLASIQGGVSNIQGGVSNIQGGDSNIQGGDSNIQGGVSNIQGGVSNIQGGDRPREVTFGRCRSTSLHMKKVDRQGREEHQEIQNNQKSEQLLNSIKQMHLKMRGSRASSLKQLWRWLKGIGYTCSNLGKWASSARPLLSGGSVPWSVVLTALAQGVALAD